MAAQSPLPWPDCRPHATDDNAIMARIDDMDPRELLTVAVACLIRHMDLMDACAEDRE